MEIQLSDHLQPELEYQPQKNPALRKISDISNARVKF